MPREAKQFFPYEKPWPDGVSVVRPFFTLKRQACYGLDTPRGEIKVYPGDWIITEGKERYVLDDETYRAGER